MYCLESQQITIGNWVGRNSSQMFHDTTNWEKNYQKKKLSHTALKSTTDDQNRARTDKICQAQCSTSVQISSLSERLAVMAFKYFYIYSYCLVRLRDLMHFIALGTEKPSEDLVFFPPHLICSDYHRTPQKQAANSIQEWILKLQVDMQRVWNLRAFVMPLG